ncbi:pentapeptide repeat protein [Kribbella flavida DSM 17836]|uniref:Pentapeptide repeat protein n=1 Tax=Kribbella flavida (strain DSM 17836 / JCM 10339 / NBRC 14399) TaxID=479435 RepID=D2Q4E3_KRIFD|nr:DinB family protein [Kribbella flavida]ADB32257.1 pentapeptide repeat protein [Kribbella flavida DSM 17836]
MSPQFGPHRWSAGHHRNDDTERFRGARFTVADLSGARFVDCDLSGVKIVDGYLADVDVSGYVERLVVNGVDVTAYVESELDRRHPERVQLREIGSAEGFRAMWTTIEQLWTATTARAERLPESLLHERVDDEWSFTETLRHLVFITDSWVNRTILDQETPYHQLALPQTAYSTEDAVALGMHVTATPPYAEVLAAREDRMKLVRDLLTPLTDADLGRPCHRSPAPGYPEGPRPVAECLAVVMGEEIDHHRYATRDLTVLESRHTP